MILLLDTSTANCRLTLREGNHTYYSEWQADRTLARHLLAYIRGQLALHNSSFEALTGIGVFRGPGSFTGLRIGITVVNTLADQLQIPIVGADGDNWIDDALKALSDEKNDMIVVPFYGRDATITTAKK